MPAAVFTDPQVAGVGLTEAAAKAQGSEVRTSTLSLDNVPRALAARDTRGLIKPVAERATRKLIGAHILAPEGADSIQTADTDPGVPGLVRMRQNSGGPHGSNVQPNTAS